MLLNFDIEKKLNMLKNSYSTLALNCCYSTAEFALEIIKF